MQQVANLAVLVFNISKVSSRDIQRHKRVMGDADSSVNSAGGWAQDVITRCSRWQQWWSWCVPNVLYLPNNPAGSRGPGVMRKNPQSQTQKKTCTHVQYTLQATWPMKDKKWKKEKQKERKKKVICYDGILQALLLRWSLPSDSWNVCFIGSHRAGGDIIHWQMCTAHHSLPPL